MKRLQKLLLLLFVCFSALRSQAQIGEYRSEFAVGASAGYVLSQVGFMPEVPQLQHKGLTAGLTARYTTEKYFSSICSIVAELNYVQVGWEEEILTPNDEPVINTYTGQPEYYKRDMSFLQIPVLARMGWGRERSGFQFFFQIGPQMGVFLGEKTNKNFNINERNARARTSQIIAQDTMAVENKLEYGLTGGVGLEFSHRKLGHFLLEGRYYYGLGDLYGNSKKDYFGRSNLTNIVVKLTYMIDLHKTNNPKIK